MKEKRKPVPIWYIILMGVLYLLPFLAMALMIFVSNIDYGLLSVMGTMMGSMVVGLLLFFPYFCVYYAALAVIHAIIDEVIVFRTSPKWLRAIFFIVTFIFSAFLAVGGMMGIKVYNIDYEGPFCWVPAAIMLVSAALNATVFQLRIVTGVAFKTGNFGEMRHRADVDVQPPMIYEGGDGVNMCDSLPTEQEEQVT